MKKVLPIIILILVGIFIYLQMSKNGSLLAPTSKIKEMPEQTVVENVEEIKSLEDFTLEILEPSNGTQIVNKAGLTVRGKTVPNADLFIADQETRADPEGNFEASVKLDEGENTIVILANNDTGDYAEKTIHITLEPIED